MFMRQFTQSSIYFLIIMLISSIARAAFAGGGDKAGGGADVLYCRNNPEPYRLLDVVESAKKGRGLDLSPAKTMLEKIALMQLRLAAVDPTRAQMYADEVTKIWQDLEAQAKNGGTAHHLAGFTGELPDIDDSQELFVESGCVKKQLFIQNAPITKEDFFYNVDGDLWKKLPADHQVAALYHEVIYKELRNLGHQTSRHTRYINSMIYSGKIEKVGACEYVEMMSNAGIKNVMLYGMTFLENKLASEYHCSEAGQLESVDGEVDYLFFGSTLIRLANLKFEGDALKSASILMPKDAWAYSSPSFFLKKMDGQFQFTQPSEEGKDLIPYTLSSGQVDFFPDGSILFNGGSLIKFPRGFYERWKPRGQGVGFTAQVLTTNDGRVISMSVRHQYHQQVSQSLSVAMESVLKCMQVGLKQKPSLTLTEDLYSITSASIDAYRENRVDLLTDHLRHCEKSVENASRLKMNKKERMKIRKAFESKDQAGRIVAHMIAPDTFCKKIGVAATGGVGVTATVGVNSGHCYRTNGQIKSVVALKVGLGVGLVASVNGGKWDDKRNGVTQDGLQTSSLMGVFAVGMGPDAVMSELPVIGVGVGGSYGKTKDIQLPLPRARKDDFSKILYEVSKDLYTDFQL